MQAVWQGKVYVPAAGREDLSFKRRYLLTEADAQRTTITRAWHH